MAREEAAQPARPAAEAWVRALSATGAAAANPTATLPALMDTLGLRFGDSPALLSGEESLSYGELAGRVRRYARWALAVGIGRGDVVALLMPNRPDYVAIWLGISRVGGVVALLNTGLPGPALAHCIAAVAPRLTIADGELAANLPELPPGTGRWTHGPGGRGDLPRIDRAVRGLSAAPLEALPDPPTIEDVALHIYTSGTTGLPKAAKVTHFRLLEWSHWFAAMMEAGPADRLYDCLPMYHSTGGVAAIGAMLVAGGSVLLRPRFSASRFWPDIAMQGCTIFQYIGELCRYLVNAPPVPEERAHRLRLCCGNGLQRDVWEPFRTRFAIPRILEFYASTEGNVTLYNTEGRPGSVGRMPPFLARRSPVALVRADPDGTPLRDAQGRCVPCAPGETGEAIGRVSGGQGGLVSRFDGYTDAAASAGKLLRDVFAAGDRWYRTGDLMRQDAAGFYYFVDRAGDTFRWKGENVSTTEVAQAVASCPGVAEAVAYGVAVPGREGRAGMAAIAVREGFAPERLRLHLAARLAEPARPLFLRICARLDVTGTFKPVKARLAREGFDPAQTTDTLYFDDRARQAYVKLDTALHGAILRGDVRA